MKTVRKTIFAAVLLLNVTSVYSQQYPQPTGYVNDFSKLLSHEQGKSLNDELASFEKRTTVEIAIVTVPWLNNQSIEDYTRGLAKEWGVGKRGQDNGIVLLIAPKERKVRIETASGVRATLTDNHANQIRDDIVLPHFKARNYAQGIIDGTHAIMRVFEEGSAATNAVPQPISKEWTARDTRALTYFFGGIVIAVPLLLLAFVIVSNRIARKHVLKNKEAIANQFLEAERAGKNSDVKEETRQRLAKLKEEFSPISQLTVTSKHVKWFKVFEKLELIHSSCNQIFSTMKQEIAFAEKARQEGPELMSALPSMIEAAEKKLASGEQSQRAKEYLSRARSLYAQAQTQQSGMSMMNWVILYTILSNARSNIASAESTLAHTHARHAISSSSSSSSASDTYGFGGTGGFGGGGGFSGGGSTGSW